MENSNTNSNTNPKEEMQNKVVVDVAIEQDFKAKYATMLKDKYKVDRHPSAEQKMAIQKEAKTISMFPRLMKIAALLFVLCGAFLVANNLMSTSSEDLGLAYLEKTEVLGNQAIMRKDNSTVDQLKADANNAFINKKYEEAIVAYKKLYKENAASDFDKFYLGISYLKQSKPNAAKALPILESLNANALLANEVRWFTSLGKLINNEKDQATAILETIVKENTYKAKEAKELLAKIK